MNCPTVFYLNQPLSSENIIKLSSEESYYLIKVLRKTRNEIVNVLNYDFIFKTKIINVEKKIVFLEILEKHHINLNKPKICLVQFITQNNKLDFLITKNVELGVDKFFFIESDNTVKLNINKFNRINKLILSAVRQCERRSIPEVKFIQKSEKELFFKNIVETKNNLCFCLNFNQNNKFPSSNILKKKNIFIIVGSEKGFSKQDDNLIKKLNIKCITINNNILRTETAGLSAISIINYLKLTE